LNLILVVPAGENRGLVAKVREVCAREPGGLARDPAQIDVARKRLSATVHGKNRLAPGEVGWTDQHLAVKPSGPEEGRVEILDAVRSADDDDLCRRHEAVQLD